MGGCGQPSKTFERSLKVLTRRPVPVEHLLYRPDQTIANHLRHRLAQTSGDQLPAPPTPDPADGTRHHGQQEADEKASREQEERVSHRSNSRSIDLQLQPRENSQNDKPDHTCPGSDDKGPLQHPENVPPQGISRAKRGVKDGLVQRVGKVLPW